MIIFFFSLCWCLSYLLVGESKSLLLSLLVLQILVLFIYLCMYLFILCSVPFFTPLCMANEEFDLRLYLSLAPVC